MSKFLKVITEDDDSKAYHCECYIIALRVVVSTKSPGDEKVYLSLRNDLKNQLRVVLSCVGSRSLRSTCNNTWFFKRYVQDLNENQHPPYSLKKVRLTKLC